MPHHSAKKRTNVRLMSFHALQKLIKNIYKPWRTNWKGPKKYLNYGSDWMTMQGNPCEVQGNLKTTCCENGRMVTKNTFLEVNFECIVLSAASMDLLRTDCI